jgi:mono/diheme cytochrome c family protein
MMAGAEKSTARNFHTWNLDPLFRILYYERRASCRLFGEMKGAIVKKSQYLAIACILLSGSVSMYGQKKGDAAKGKDVFEQCSVCHNADSTERKMGPGLKGLFKKGKLDSNGKPANDANVIEKINEGGNGMPAYKDMLTDDEKANLIAYLKTL